MSVGATNSVMKNEEDVVVAGGAAPRHGHGLVLLDIYRATRRVLSLLPN
jgi:hypothetical protein